jgi:hypothetical protein
MKKGKSLKKETVNMDELRMVLARLKQKNPGKKITYDFIKNPKYPKGYVIRIDGKIISETSMSSDHEVAMAMSSLKEIVSNASQLMDKLGGMERDIPGWIQDHITNAENYIEQANQGFHELQ